MVKYLFIYGIIFFLGCDDTRTVKRSSKSTYISPSVNYKGQFKKGYVRRAVSTKPNAIIHQSKSRYYYKTRGKYNKNR